jgi:hypothetical protein
MSGQTSRMSWRIEQQVVRGEIEIIDFNSICASERIKWLREFGKNSLHSSYEDCEMRIEWIERRIEIATIAFDDLEASKCSGKKDFDQWPPESLVAGYIIVRLKKARNYLIGTLHALDSAHEESLATPQWRSLAQLEVNGIYEQTLHFLREARALFPTGLDDDLGVF